MTRSLPLIGALLPCALVLTGCSRAPLVNVLGSFVPVWMFCILAGVALTLIARALLVRARLEHDLGPLMVVYPGMVALFACAVWLVCFQY